MPSADIDVLGWGEDKARAHNLPQLRTKPVDDIHGAGITLIQRLQGGIDESLVRSAGAADGGNDARDGRVARNHGVELLLQLLHLVRRDGSGRLRLADQVAGILDREEALWQHEEEPGRRGDGGEKARQRPTWMAKRHVERALVAIHKPVEARFGDPVEPPVPLPVLRFQEAAREHRRERERDERRDDDGDGDRHGELVEEAPDNAAHEKEGDEDRNQGQADGKNGEPDFARSLVGRLKRQHALFDVPLDVLHFDDGVVDHEADGDGEPHEREIVEAVAQRIHRRKRADDRDRNGQPRNDRGPQIAQENEHDGHHEHHGQDKRELNVRDGSANGRGAVDDRRDIDAGRNVGAERRQFLLDAVHRVDDVGARLLEHDQRDGALLSNPGRNRGIRRAFHGAADVPDADRRAIPISDDEIVIRRCRRQLVIVVDRIALGFAADRAFRGLNGGVCDDRLHIGKAQSHFAELGRVDLDADRRRLLSSDDDLRHARDICDICSASMFSA